MCIVSDPPALLAIFKPDHEKHAEFSPVRDWVVDGPGKFVMGGTLYKQELSRLKSLIPLLGELKRKNKIISVEDDVVDKRVVELQDLEPTKDFDDPHLVAISNSTGCKLIGIIDPRAHRFLRRTDFYIRLKDRPSLYTRAKNSNLLCQKNIVKCCK